ncbi:MAG: type II toxin-antitoxin system Phd/YefM family antitoxin [Egibacteraceae bacterium]
MDLTEDIEPVTSLKRGAAELIARATERHSPIVITQNGRPTAVLQDVASYERRRRALHLLKLAAQGDRDYDDGKVHDPAAVDAAVRQRLDQHGRVG